MNDDNGNLPERTATALSGRVLDRQPETSMLHPKFDEAPEPDRYRRMADDPTACRAMAAEVLDFAFDGLSDGKDIRDLATLSNCWMRLSELASRSKGDK